MRYERILLPVAGDPDEEVVTHAARLADAAGASIHVLYVIDQRLFPDPASLYDVGTSDVATDELLSSYESEGERAVRTVAALLSERMPESEVETHVEQGVPADVICRYAARNDVDAVVMATHERTTPRDRILGSVTQRVIRAGTVPVLVIPPSITAEG